MVNKTLTGPGRPEPDWVTPTQARAHALLASCAVEFAAACRAAPHTRFPRDAARRPELLYGSGLGVGEAAGFVRAVDEGLVVVAGDGGFLVPGARACSTSLHLVGRNEDHVVLHTEYLIQLTAYAELVHSGWAQDRLVFDPFFGGAALDIWGYAHPPTGRWRDGQVVLGVEAKSRVAGSDGLAGLRSSLLRLSADPATPTRQNHFRKWQELVSLTRGGSRLELLLAAEGASWWFTVTTAGDSIHLDEH